MKNIFRILLSAFLAQNATITAFSQISTLYESKDLYITDTVLMQDPIVVIFQESNIHHKKVGLVLVSKSKLDTISPKPSYEGFLLNSDCALFFSEGRFTCILNNYLFQSNDTSKFYLQLLDKMRNSEKSKVWVYRDETKQKPKLFNGWPYDEIYPRKFLVALVKESLLHKCQSIDEIQITNSDNIYLKIYVPIPESY